MAEKDGKLKKIRFRNLKAIRRTAVSFILVLAMTTGIAGGLAGCSKKNKDDTPPASEELPDTLPTITDAEATPSKFNYEYANTTQVGYFGEIIGKYERVKPVEEIKDERAAFDSEATGSVFANNAKRYPTYGSTLKHVLGSGEAQVAARGAIIGESGYLCAWGTRGANRGGTQTPDKYTKIDADGYLYQLKGNEWVHSLVWGKTEEENTPENYRRLYEHTAANGMYLENYTRNGVTYNYDDAEGVVKEITMRSRGYSSYGVTGLYAPAGEVIKVEISGKDMNATGGISIHIGQALYNGQANNIWTGKNQMQRFPHILTSLVLNKSTCEYNEETDTWTGYVGSFLGGPIYVRNASVTFTAKISGGLEYLHFILGYTTKAEFERIKKESKVPYFDLEVWNYGVLHSGPRYYAEGFSYDNLYNAAILWEKVSSVTTTNGSKQGVVFIYDPFVAAGAAVAFPGRSSVNCPLGWMSQSLNYNTLVTSGSWGNFHEYHHNFQNFGLGSGADGETTNNALTLVSYSLFTNISAKRGINSYGSQGLGGWNNYTSAPWVLQRVKAGQITSTNGLAVYATLLHNFGADAFIRARGASGKNNYLNKWATVTHNDFSYFASLIGTTFSAGNYTPSDAVKNANYPMFVPVSCVYQTGRSYMYDGEKKYFKTMQPYVIANTPFNIDLSPYTTSDEGQYLGGSIVIPDGFTYSVKSISKPQNGSIEVLDNFNIKYTPAKGAKTGSTSGQIVVTLEITKDDGAFEVEDVDLVLEFQISQEFNKMTLERTTYTFTEDTMYSDAVEAYNAGFAGSTDGGLEQDQFNPTQNANTDIWFYPDTEDYHNKYPDAPDKYFFHDNSIEVIDGKLHFDEDGTYRVYLRGRDNCALYYSPDGNSYTLGARITKETAVQVGSNKKANTALFRTNAAETYFDVKFDQGRVYVKGGADADFPSTEIYKISANSNGEIENWLYIKEVLIVDSVARSFIGVGMRQWTETMFTVTETYHDASGNKLESADDENFAYTQTTYKDYNGFDVALSRKYRDSETAQYFKKSGTSWVDSTEKEVSELTESKMIEPTVTEKTQPYANAYRSDYDFPDNSSFKSEYFYIREYSYSYAEASNVSSHKLLDYTNFEATLIGGKTYPIENLFNGKSDGMWDENSKAKKKVNPNNPFTMTVDAKQPILANTMALTGRNGSTPGEFKLFVGDSLDDLKQVEFTDTKKSGTTGVTVTFEPQRFRYYRLEVTRMIDGKGELNGNYLSMTSLKFNYSVSGGKIITPDNGMFKFTGNWSIAQANSTFGHVYKGAKDAEMTFDFEGTGFKIISSDKFGDSFKVYIDGIETQTLTSLEDNGIYHVSFFSENLEQGTHTVKLVCGGESSIDSVVII